MHKSDRFPAAHKLTLTAFLLVLWIPFTNLIAEEAQAPLPKIQLGIDGKLLIAEIASTGNQRYMGLSFRSQLANDAGMLFVYPDEQALTFTMRNTRIPLSIAFITEDLVINEIHLMNVGPGQLFPSGKPAKYALEVNQGWFARHGIEPGTRVVMR
jgi:uncharacterized membrane protein (UPF0127 family)